MIFQESPLYDQAMEIASADKASGFYQWDVQFKLLEDAPIDLTDEDLAVSEREREGYFTPFKVTNLDFVRNYEGGNGAKNYEIATISARFPAGMWYKVLYPCRKYVKVVITRTQLLGKDLAPDPDVEPLIIERDVLFTDPDSLANARSPISFLTRKELDIRDIIAMEIELIDPAMEQISRIMVGGTWRRCTAGDVMKAVIAKALQDVTVEGEPAITSFVIEEGMNKDKREHVSLDHGTALFHVPTVLQTKMGGIWPSGINHFYQDRTLYIYPPYDTTHFDDKDKTLTIIKVPSSILPLVANTFVLNGDKITAISTSVTGEIDDSELKFLVLGDGVRFSKASSIDTDWVETKDNKAITRRSQVNSELQINAPGVTKHFNSMGMTRFTDNTMVDYSLLAARAGYITTIVWDNADQTLLYPRMPVKILEVFDGDVVEREGVLLNVQISARINDSGVEALTHRTTAVLSVFCSNKEKNETA